MDKLKNILRMTHLFKITLRDIEISIKINWRDTRFRFLKGKVFFFISCSNVDVTPNIYVERKVYQADRTKRNARRENGLRNLEGVLVLYNFCETNSRRKTIRVAFDSLLSFLSYHRHENLKGLTVTNFFFFRRNRQSELRIPFRLNLNSRNMFHLYIYSVLK